MTVQRSRTRSAPITSALPPTETTHMQTFTDGVVQAMFMLQLGYFKAS